MRTTCVIILGAVALCARGQRPTERSSAQHQQVTETYKSPEGVVYEVTRVKGFRPEQLPQNSDLKMADGDLVKYAATACTLDVPPDTAPARCDLYVQPDRSGTLIGYAALTQSADGVSFETYTTVNEQKEPGGKACDLSGNLYASGESRRIVDAARDFDGRIMYSAWEKSPGEFLVSQVGPTDTLDTGDSTALGVCLAHAVAAGHGDPVHLHSRLSQH